MNGGAYAEYVAVPQDHLALKLNNVSFEQAAAVPTAGTIALNNLGGAARPKRQTVLVNGAGGCMGLIAVQIAKADGAQVMAVDCAEKLPMLRALGADHVIDYRQEDYLRTGERYHLIIDLVGFRRRGRVSTSAKLRAAITSPSATLITTKPRGRSWATYRDWGPHDEGDARSGKAKSFKFLKKPKRWRYSAGSRRPESSRR